MNLNLYIAKKIKGKSGEKGKLSPLSNIIACASVAISILVMFIAIAISDGFKREIKDIISGFSAEVVLYPPGAGVTNELYKLSGKPSYLDELQNMKGVESVSGVVYKSGMLRSEESVQGVFFKGVDSTYNLRFYEKNLVEGRLPDFSTRRASNDILISKRLANLMEYKCGDEIFAYFVDEGVRVRKFTVCGLYDVRLEDMDKTMTIVDIRQTRGLNRWKPDMVSSMEVTLVPGADPGRVVGNIDQLLMKEPQKDDSVIVNNIRNLYPHIFDWLDLLDLNVLIILTLMIVVAGFNMISGLLIILFEKISMIGLLKALGMKTKDICKVFIYRGAFIVLKGMAIGNLIAIIVAILQGSLHIIPLDPANYFVDHVPIFVNVWKMVILNMASFALILLVMIVPTLFIARVQPDKTIKMN